MLQTRATVNDNYSGKSAIHRWRVQNSPQSGLQVALKYFFRWCV